MVEKVIILGAGPAGLSAAIYTSREGFEPLVIGGYNPGGQLLLTTVVENIPGFPDGIDGPELVSQMRKQAEKFGTRFINEDVSSVDFSRKPYKVVADNKTYETESVIVATGANAKWLGIESEQKFRGRGVSSCATCLPPSSLIVANASTMKIKDIEHGQRVLTGEGLFQPISEITKRYFSGELIKFKTRFFRSEWTLLTPNHPILVKLLKRGTGTYYHRFQWSEKFWLEAGKLTKDHVVLYPIPKQEVRFGHIDVGKLLKLPVDKEGYVRNLHETYSSHRIRSKILINRSFARLIGYFLSDGYSHSRGISFAFSKHEKAYADDCKRIIWGIFRLRASIKLEKSVLKVTASSLVLSKLFENLFGKYSHEKKLPHDFVLLKKEIQEEIIKGMWRGDGCIRKEDFVITTSSRELIEQLKLILLRLEVLPGVEKRRFDTLKTSVIEDRTVKFKKNVYQLIIGGPWLKRMSEIVGIKHPLIKSRKHVNYHGWIIGDYVHLPIKEILHQKYSGMVYNLAVMNGNTYVTTNSIVHNCDAAFFKNKNVIVVGGGDTAMEDSLFLTRFATEVTVVHRRDSLKASKIMQERARNNTKIKFIWNSTVEEIKGDSHVTGVVLKNLVTGEKSEMPIDGVFIAVGYSPNTGPFKGKLKLDDQGYIVTVDEVLTDIEGIYVAGDVADKFYRQAATAAGSGVKAALHVREYLSNLEYERSQAKGNS